MPGDTAIELEDSSGRSGVDGSDPVAGFQGFEQHEPTVPAAEGAIASNPGRSVTAKRRAPQQQRHFAAQQQVPPPEHGASEDEDLIPILDESDTDGAAGDSSENDDGIVHCRSSLQGGSQGSPACLEAAAGDRSSRQFLQPAAAKGAQLHQQPQETAATPSSTVGEWADAGGADAKSPEHDDMADDSACKIVFDEEPVLTATASAFLTPSLPDTKGWAGN